MGAAVKIFGIGLNRTGTSSLKKALRRMGYRVHPYSPSIVRRALAGDLEGALDATNQYDAFQDWPWPLIYKEIFEHFGSDAKFILTQRRTPEVWLNSLKNHSTRTGLNNPRKAIYGHAYPHAAEAEYIAFYNRHLAEVRSFFKAQDAEDQLLEVCWDAGDGWVQLAGFLGHRPRRDAFPHVNKTSEASIEGDEELYAENLRRIAAQVAEFGENSTKPQ
ncbi:MAG TPA: sulfotransferase [Paracoccaceae bacterium]|nr:sulfotransferase [Paracoccaceae bacterium]